MNLNIEQIKNKALPILKNADVIRSSIFGSYARGDMVKESDLDILVEFKGKKNLLDLVGLQLALEKALEKKVDVLTYRSLYPPLREIIEKEQVKIL